MALSEDHLEADLEQALQRQAQHARAARPSLEALRERPTAPPHRGRLALACGLAVMVLAGAGVLISTGTDSTPTVASQAVSSDPSSTTSSSTTSSTTSSSTTASPPTTLSETDPAITIGVLSARFPAGAIDGGLQVVDNPGSHDFASGGRTVPIRLEDQATLQVTVSRGVVVANDDLAQLLSLGAQSVPPALLPPGYQGAYRIVGDRAEILVVSAASATPPNQSVDIAVAGTTALTVDVLVAAAVDLLQNHPLA